MRFSTTSLRASSSHVTAQSSKARQPSTSIVRPVWNSTERNSQRSYPSASAFNFNPPSLWHNSTDSGSADRREGSHFWIRQSQLKVANVQTAIKVVITLNLLCLLNQKPGVSKTNNCAQSQILGSLRGSPVNRRCRSFKRKVIPCCQN
jgi:hypothetical protein